MFTENHFSTRAAATAAVASRIETALRRQLAANDRAAMVVSGGSTPAAVYRQLAQSPLDWQRVEVFLSDERWVPAEHQNSNEKMLRETLLTAAASVAELIPFYAGGSSLQQQCDLIAERIRRLPNPFACALLGMGEDGHFASLFPDASNLQQGIDPETSQFCIPVKTAASSNERLSLTLSALTRSDEILLLIYGRAKRTVIERAAEDGSGLPVAQLLAQQRTPVHLFWAP